MGRVVRVAATQFKCGKNVQENWKNAEQLVRNAAKDGAQIILLQELFSNVYFCQEQDPKWYLTAIPSPLSSSSSSSCCSCSEMEGFFEWACGLAKELGVVLPVSFFEKAGNCYFNSLVVVDADGTILDGLYRKSHIPDGPGYQEKFYFSPGDTGFKVWKTKYATIGVGICWDQWFPETARSLTLLGAEILFFPTAIGSEPQDSSINSVAQWQRAMQGHAATNVVPVVASNRIGFERLEGTPSIASPCSGMTFYGSSFITDASGEKVAEMDKETSGFIASSFDLDDYQMQRAAWGVFRDRRTDLYKVLTTKDGQTNATS